MNEIEKMQTPWDSDKVLMVDRGCFERGCVCVASDFQAGQPMECVPVVEYTPMNDEMREMDLALAECEQENRLLRARNERLNIEVQLLTEALRAKVWVGLTDKERNELWRDVVKWGDPSHDDVDLMKVIEAKLKEKNGG